MSTYQGSCRCGGVAIEARGKTHFQGYCHCDDCRRSNGAPIVSFAGFERDQFEWTSQETLAEWRNGQFKRLFCRDCGSPIAYTDDQLPEVVFFYTGFMENQEAFPPEHHSYHHRKIDWLELVDDLPKFEQTSYPRPE
ncbi:MAG: GFA family protein [Rhizobiaceae bacterium]|nr:GFA family protein [Rhizobiaceae bacterium]